MLKWRRVLITMLSVHRVFAGGRCRESAKQISGYWKQRLTLFKLPTIGLGLIALTLHALGPMANGQVMHFDDLPSGTLFGVARGDSPADVVYSRNGIDMAVEPFFLGSFVGFYEAKVGGPYASAFATPALELDNISVLFSFDAVGFAVDAVSFDYQEFGGAVNIAVNGGPLLQLDSLSGLPFDVAPGVMGSVLGGTVTLTAPAGTIANFQVGGQELVIDNLQAIPEPATAILLSLGILAAMTPNLRGRYLRQ